ncbi:MAG: hypothetical protein ABSC05_18650 [Candidatus Solibacter sp.]|jgi:hypothetical protein
MPEPIELPIAEQAPAAEPTPAAAPPKVTFDDAQKARINEIVKEASARAGAEARAEVARLKAALPAEPQSTDALLRLAQAEAELAALKSEAAESRVREVLHAAVSKQPFFDGQLASEILRSSVRLIDGKPVVVDASGTPRLNSEFREMSLSEAVEELATAKPFLVRGQLKGGVGSVMAASRAETGPKLEDLFGKNSNGAAANQLGLRNPAKYRELRAQAVKAGLLFR